jgi:NAD(P)-dependent dehydrogenase (short-subunit alcohol dehydrogenase family)
MHPRTITGTVALVTGANRGIGRAIVEALLRRGAKKVYATARQPESLKELGDARIVPLKLDVTDPAQIRSVCASALDVELLISNAGVAVPGGLTGPDDLDAARQQMEVNFFGPFQLFQGMLPLLAKNGGGGAVFIGSLAGLTPVPFVPTYSASKAALHSLTLGARMLFGARGTSIFGVYPGPVDTDMSRSVDMPKATPQAVASAILDGIEAGVEDIYPDPYAADFGRVFGASPKASERQFAAMASSAE